MRKQKRTNEQTFEFHLNLLDKIVVSDPCYDFGEWCQTTLNIKGGEYIAKVEQFDANDGWGIRNYILTLNHISCPKKRATTYESYLGVDSGQMGIFDAKYYQEKQPNEDWYHKICQITLSEDSCGLVDNMGIVTSSGCGDGGYELKVGMNKNDEIVALKISFL